MLSSTVVKPTTITTPTSPYILPPQSTSVTRSVLQRSTLTTRTMTSISHFYDNLVVKRLQYFQGTDDNSACVAHVSKESDYCTASFLLVDIVKFGRAKTDLCVRLNGTESRMVSRIQDGIATAVQRRKRYCWFPVKLSRNEFHSHANALLVDTKQRTVWLFEPHGSDPTSPLHGDGFFHLYDAAQYYALCRDLVDRAYPGSRFYSPADYQPGVFGQSLSQDGMADRFCVFWTLYFFLEATRTSPCEFVAMIQGAYESGNLRALVRAALVDMSHNLHVVMR